MGNHSGEKEEDGEDTTKTVLGGLLGADLLEPRGVRRFPPQMAAVTLSSSSSGAAPPGSPALRSPAQAAASSALSSSPPPSPSSSPMRDETLAAIIGGKPLLCIAFDRMEMDVGSPVKVGG